MRAFIAYSLEVEHIDKLKGRIRVVTEAAKMVGVDTYAHIREDQDWVPYSSSMSDTLDQAFRTLRKCDLLIADFTAFENKNRTGVKIECGFAKALDLPIVSLIHDNDRPRMLADLADYEIRYKDLDEIRRALPPILTQVAANLNSRV